jgi:cephalosporin hydroxylase
MNGDREFVRALSDYLALHTEQSSGYLAFLIASFLRGPHERPKLEQKAKDELASRLKTDLATHNNVPSFLQTYLHTHLAHGEWPPQATFLASRYLQRGAGERFVNWQRRQQRVAELEGEPIRGTELGYRQMLYSQGAETVFRWRGVPCFKTNYDLAIYAMLIDELRPATIIELGAGSGGSALLYADWCASMGLTTRIVSIDTAKGEVSDPRIEFVQADSVEWLAAAAKAKLELPRPCLMIEDFHGDLAGFFGYVDSILESGDYLVVEDSTSKQKRLSEVIAGRPYLIDTKYTDFFGVNCTSAINGIFQKDSGSPAPQSREQQERQRLREQDRAWRQRQRGSQT